MPTVIGGLIAAAILIAITVFFFRGSGPSRPSAGEQSQSESTAPQPQPSPANPGPTARATKPATAAPAPKTTTRLAPSKASTPKTAGSMGGAQGVAIHQVLPDISKSARNTITGHIKVNVRVEVDSSGKVSSAKLVNAGPSRYFAGKALQASQQWGFTPPQVGGQPARSAWMLHYRFGRARTEVSPEQLNR
jgi:TonB family protein